MTVSVDSLQSVSIQRQKNMTGRFHRRIKEELGNMSLQVEKLEKNMAKLTIEASSEELENAVQKA